MAILKGCFGSAESGHQYKLQVHALFVWTNVGSCQFIQTGPDTYEVKGDIDTTVYKGDLDIIINSSTPYLTVNGTADNCATIEGCTIKACDTLNGMSVTLSPDGKDTVSRRLRSIRISKSLISGIFLMN